MNHQNGKVIKKNKSYLEQNTSNAKSKILNNLEIMSKFKK